MTHAAGTTLFAYWDSLRGGRPAPERSDIDPRAIGPILGDTFVLEGDLTGALPYRLAGSRISTLFAREMKGESFTALFTELGRQAFHRGLSLCRAKKEWETFRPPPAGAWGPANRPRWSRLHLLMSPGEA